MPQRLLAVLVWCSVAAAGAWGQDCPTIELASEVADVCIGGEVTVTATLNGDFYPEYQTPKWYSGGATDFNPGNDGTVVLPVAPRYERVSPMACEAAPELLAVRYDGGRCGPNNTCFNDVDEVLIYWSGSGFDAGDLVVEFAQGNIDGIGDDPARFNCRFEEVPTGERTLDAPCVIYADDRRTSTIPPNAYVVILLNSRGTPPPALEALCRGAGVPVYVLRAGCSGQGRLSNSHNAEVYIDFGCGRGDVDYEPRAGAASNQTNWYLPNETPRWAGPVDRDFLPALTQPAATPVSFRPVTFQYGPAASECGTRYVRAFTEDRATSCLLTPTSNSLAVEVACPTVAFAGAGQTVCFGTAPDPVRLSLSGSSYGFDVIYEVDGSPQAPLSDARDGVALDIPAGLDVGSHTVTLFDVRANGCAVDQGDLPSYTITVVPSSAPDPRLPERLCTSPDPYRLGDAQAPEGYPGGTWVGNRVSAAGGAYLLDRSTAGIAVVTYSYPDPTGTNCIEAALTTIGIVGTTQTALPDTAVCAFATVALDDLSRGATGGSWEVDGSPASGSTLELTDYTAGSTIALRYVIAGTGPSDCGEVITRDLVIQPAEPTLLTTASTSACVGDGLSLYEFLKDPSAAGEWKLVGTDATIGGDYTISSASAGEAIGFLFTPAPETCRRPATLTVEVGDVERVTLPTAPVCIGAFPIPNLATLAGVSGGTWSRDGVAVPNLNLPLGGATAGETIGLLYETSPGSGYACGAEFAFAIDVEANATIEPRVLSPVCGGGTVQLADLLDYATPAPPPGLWSVPGAGAIPTGGAFVVPQSATPGQRISLRFTPDDECVNPVDATVTVGALDETPFPNQPVCDGRALDLVALLPAGTRGTWLRGDTPVPNPAAYRPTGPTDEVRFFREAADGVCGLDRALVIEVSPAVQPEFAAGVGACAGTTFDLSTLYRGAGDLPAGTWTSVGAAELDGSRWTVPASGAPQSFTYTPASSVACGAPVTVSVAVVAADARDLPPVTLCALALDTFDLAKQRGGLPGGAWGFGGSPLANDVFELPDGSEGGTFELTYATPPAGDDCGTVATLELTVTPTPAVTLSQNRLACAGTPFALSTLLGDESAAGTWSSADVPVDRGVATVPAGYPGDGFEVTFTPAVGTCLRPSTVRVRVSRPETIDLLADLTACGGEFPLDLNTRLPNSVEGGLWTYEGAVIPGGRFTPAPDGRQTGTFSFAYTIAGGVASCGRVGYLAATVTASAPVALTVPSDSLCAGTRFTLAPYVEGGVEGTWVSSEGLEVAEDGSFEVPADGTGRRFRFAFEPAPGTCRSGAELEVVVRGPRRATLLAGTACALKDSFDLVDLIPNATERGGRWAGAGGSIVEQRLGLAGLSGPIALEYTPAGNCVRAQTTELVVASAIPAPLTTDRASVCTSDFPLDLAPFVDGPAVEGGLWFGDPAIVDGRYAPMDAPEGERVVRYGSADSLENCIVSGALTLVIGAGAPVALTPGRACAGQSIPLASLFADGPVAGTWVLLDDDETPVPGPNFDVPDDAIGAVTLRFTPEGDGACAKTNDVTVAVTDAVTPDVVTDKTICRTAPPLALSTLTDPAYPGGLWRLASSGAVVTEVDPRDFPDDDVVEVVFEPEGGECVSDVSVGVKLRTPMTPKLDTIFVCRGDAPISLNRTLPVGVPDGTWAAPDGVTVFAGDSLSLVGLPEGLTLLRYVPEGCALPADQAVVVSLGPEVILQNDVVVCRFDEGFDLSELIVDASITGVWSSEVAGVIADGLLNTTTVTEDTLRLTFDPIEGCVSASATRVIVADSNAYSLDSLRVCKSIVPYSLDLELPPAVRGGVWSGALVVDNKIDASEAVPFTVTYTPPRRACAVPETADGVIEEAEVNLALPTIDACAGVPVELYFAEADLPPTQQGGIWTLVRTNQDIPNSVLSPDLLEPGANELAYRQRGQCGASGKTVVTLTTPTPPVLKDVSLCVLDGTFDLNSLIVEGASGGTWERDGVVVSNDFSADLSEPIALTYTVTDDAGCTSSADAVISRRPGTPIVLGVGVRCVTSQLSLGELLPDGSVSGTWTDAGGLPVTIAKPALDNLGNRIPGTYTYTFTPDDNPECLAAATTTVTFEDGGGVSDLADTTLCATQAFFDFGSVELAGLRDITWRNPEGEVVSGFAPAEVTDVTFTYAGRAGTCEFTGEKRFVIETPTAFGFDVETLRVCRTSEAFDLGTLFEGEVPEGRWSVDGEPIAAFVPDRFAAAAVTLTFTKDNACEDAASIPVEIAAPEPVALESAPVCEGQAELDLNTLFPGEPIPGTWTSETVTITGATALLADLPNGIYRVTFRPDEVCGDESSAQIVIRSGGSLAGVDRATCDSGGEYDLRNLLSEGAPGEWRLDGVRIEGSTVDLGDFSPGAYTFTFTPVAACLASVTATLVIEAPSTLPILPIRTCAGPDSLDLTEYEVPGALGGVWSIADATAGTGVIGAMAFVRDAGTFALTYTPLARDCSAPVEVSLTVSEPETPTLAAPSAVCLSDPAIPLSSLFVDEPIAGTWSGEGLRDEAFDPSAAGVGEAVLTFDPEGGCVPPVDVTIEVVEGGVLRLSSTSVCDTETAFDLSAIADPAFPDGTWTLADGTVLEAILDVTQFPLGALRLTFTPALGCILPKTAVLTVTSDAAAVGLPRRVPVCSADGLLTLSSLFTSGVVVGTWRADGVAISADGVVDLTTLRTGEYELTFSPAACGEDVAVTLAVIGADRVVLSAARWCGPALIDLSGYETSPGGTWAGPGVSGRTFDPSAASVTADTLTYRFGESCPSVLLLPFSLAEGVALADSTVSVCGGGLLTLADYEPDDATGGEWRSVTGEVVTELDVGALAVGATAPLTYLVTRDGCGVAEATYAFTRVISLTVDSPEALAVCLDAGERELSELFPALPAGGAWSGPGVDGGRYLPGRPDGPTELAYAPPGACYDSASYSVTVVDVAPLATTLPVVTCQGNTFSAEIVLEYTTNNGEITPSLGILTGAVLTVTGALTDLPTAVTIADEVGCTPDLTVVLEDNCRPLNACAPASPGAYPDLATVLCPNKRSTDAGYSPPETIRAGDGFRFELYADTTAAPLLSQANPTFDFGAYAEGSVLFVRAFHGVLLDADALDPDCTIATPAHRVVIGGQPEGARDTVVCVGAPLELYGRTFTFDEPTLQVTIPSGSGGCDSLVLLSVNFDGGDVPIVRRPILCENEVYDAFARFGEVFDVDRPMGTFSLGNEECSVTYEVNATFKPLGRRSFSDDLCAGDSVFIGGRYVTESTEIILVGAAENDCDSIIDVAIATYERPVLTAAVEPLDCDPDQITVTFEVGGERDVEASIQNGDAAAETYRLNPGRTTLGFPLEGEADLFVSQVTATDGGCRVPEVAEFRINPPVSRLRAEIVPSITGLPFTACPGSPMATASVQPFDGIGPFSYAWSRGDSSRTIAEVEAGDYAVTVTDAFGCEATAPLTVGFNDSIAYEVDVPDIVCADGLGAVAIEVFSAEPGLRYAFDREEFQPLDVPLVERTGLVAGDYAFQLSRENGCEQSALLAVVPPVPPAIFAGDTVRVRLGDSLQFALDYPAGTTVQWTPAGAFRCDTCLTTSVRLAEDLRLTAAVTEPTGCVTVDSVYVLVEPALEVFLPTAFSPNDDGTNDVYLPLAGPGVERFLGFEVFSRWGEPVHQRFGFFPGDPEAAWDGRWKGKDLDTGVFVTVARVQLVNGGEATVTGEVTLMR